MSIMWLKLSCRTNLRSHSEVSFARVVRSALHRAGAQLNHVVMQPRLWKRPARAPGGVVGLGVTC